jgi:hypothetical protein
MKLSAAFPAAFLQGVHHEGTKAQNCLRLLQLRRNQPALDGPLPQLRKLEYHE